MKNLKNIKDFVNEKSVNSFSKEDLQKAFEDGKSYGRYLIPKHDNYGDFDAWFNKTYGTNENVLPKPCLKIKCLECGEEVCDTMNQKIWHLYNKHNCKPSVDDYKAKKMLKQYFTQIVKESLGNSPFKIGMKVDMIEHKAGKLIFYCENDSIIIEVAPAGGASIVFSGDIDEVFDAQIIEIRENDYEIDLSFDNANDIHMEDDTGGEGLEAWIR